MANPISALPYLPGSPTRSCQDALLKFKIYALFFYFICGGPAHFWPVIARHSSRFWTDRIAPRRRGLEADSLSSQEKKSIENCILHTASLREVRGVQLVHGEFLMILIESCRSGRELRATSIVCPGVPIYNSTPRQIGSSRA